MAELSTLTVDELNEAQHEAMREIIRLAAAGKVAEIAQATERVSAVERELMSR